MQKIPVVLSHTSIWHCQLPLTDSCSDTSVVQLWLHLNQRTFQLDIHSVYLVYFLVSHSMQNIQQDLSPVSSKAVSHVLWHPVPLHTTAWLRHALGFLLLTSCVTSCQVKICRHYFWKKCFKNDKNILTLANVWQSYRVYCKWKWLTYLFDKVYISPEALYMLWKYCVGFTQSSSFNLCK